MSENRPKPVSGDAGLWADLRRLTAARIGLERSGASLATVPLLGFKLDHARARDAVHEPLDEARLVADLAGLDTMVLSVASAAADRKQFLMRPDLGRRLAPGTDAALTPHAADHDVVFVIADGLSARAVQSHAGEVVKTRAARPCNRTAGVSRRWSSSATDGSPSATPSPHCSAPNPS